MQLPVAARIILVLPLLWHSLAVGARFAAPRTQHEQAVAYRQATTGAGIGPAQSAVTPTPFDSLRLRLTLGKQVVMARLVDNETTRAFVKLLPLTLRLSDLGGREKYSGLPDRLPTPAAAVRTSYQPGDLSYWLGGGLAVFYHQDDHQVQAGLVVLAHLESEATRLFAGPGSVRVTLEAVAH